MTSAGSLLCFLFFLATLLSNPDLYAVTSGKRAFPSPTESHHKRAPEKSQFCVRLMPVTKSILQFFGSKSCPVYRERILENLFIPSKLGKEASLHGQINLLAFVNSVYAAKQLHEIASRIAWFVSQLAFQVHVQCCFGLPCAKSRARCTGSARKCRDSKSSGAFQ